MCPWVLFPEGRGSLTKKTVGIFTFFFWQNVLYVVGHGIVLRVSTFIFYDPTQVSGGV